MLARFEQWSKADDAIAAWNHPNANLAHNAFSDLYDEEWAAMNTLNDERLSSETIVGAKGGKKN